MDFIFDKRAFTLVELSIVLVILGLLVGGVLTGQSLIRAAELRSITTQYNAYITATNTFKDKYFALPGDMTNATAFWGLAAAGSACYSTVGTGTQTCNGNGDNILGHDNTLSSNEGFRFWQQLSSAGLTAGYYTGVAEDTNAYSAGPTNSPKGKINSAYWELSNYGVLSGSSQWFDGLYNNAFQYGGYLTNNSPGGVIFSPSELWNIDTKIDDGKPGTGFLVVRVRSVGFSACTDATVSSQTAANYLLSATGSVCSIMLRNIF